jgi:Ca2+-binding EF-hand superfamily protein
MTKEIKWEKKQKYERFGAPVEARVDGKWCLAAYLGKFRKWEQEDATHTVAFFNDPSAIPCDVDSDDLRQVYLVSIRSCRHIYCLDCVKKLNENKCPECRKPFSECVSIPDLFQNPEAWFEIIDFDGDNALSKREIEDVLKCYFKVDPKNPNALRQHLRKNWHKFSSPSPTYTGGIFPWIERDEDGDKFINPSEFTERLLPFLQATLRSLDDMKDCSEIPDWRQSPNEWFDFWDYDKSGELERPEVIRALAKTLKGEWTMEQIRSVVDGTWSDFDENRDGGISKREFRQRHGLYDTLAANLLCPTCTRLRADPQNCEDNFHILEVEAVASPARNVVPYNRELPQGWVELPERDSQGRTIFVNVATRAKQIHRPTEAAVEEDKKTNDDTETSVDTETNDDTEIVYDYASGHNF